MLGAGALGRPRGMVWGGRKKEGSKIGVGDTNNRGDGSASGGMGDLLDAVDLGSGIKAKAIVAGGSHTCAILDNSAIKCWGRRDEGQMGKGGKNGELWQIGDGSTPYEMGDSLTSIELGTGITATAIAAGYHHTCAILDNSSIKCWGSNNAGQLGLGDTNNRGDLDGNGVTEMGDNLPSVDLGAGRTARAIAAGDNHTCVVLDDASIKCWGSNTAGQLGLGNTSNRGDNSSQMGGNLPVISL